jgi:uroporphyrinogen decarboxylase
MGTFVTPGDRRRHWAKPPAPLHCLSGTGLYQSPFEWQPGTTLYLRLALQFVIIDLTEASRKKGNPLMTKRVTRRRFINSMLAGTAALAGRQPMFAETNKRDAMLGLLEGKAHQDYIPAAFFLHFDKSCHFGQAAVNKHLEYFRATGMDFVKIQYERTFPPLPDIKKPEDWKKMPLYSLDFYQPALEAVKGLVQAAKKEALVLVTLYSPFMCAGHTVTHPVLTAHFHEDPEPVKKGLEIITDSLMLFVKECIRLGVDGFYASTQGGEAGRLKDARLFREYIKPSDLALMKEINRACIFNILHVCDYRGPYDDLSPYLDYPGHLVNCNPQLASRRLPWKEMARMFKRPCMGGLDRQGTLVSGSKAEIRKAVEQALSEATQPFVLGADCTLPSDIPWENIRTAIDAAHGFKKTA